MTKIYQRRQDTLGFPYLKMTAVLPSCWSILKRVTGARSEQKGFDIAALPSRFTYQLLPSTYSQLNSRAFQELSV